VAFPASRPRRLRRSETIRSMVRETRLSRDDLILPLFVVPGSGVEREVSSMPGVFQQSVDRATNLAVRARDLGVRAVLLFGLPEKKDASGSESAHDDGPVQSLVRSIKKIAPDVCVITDVCLCEYTDHGHCGVIENGDVANDPTLELLAKEAVSHARAGADIVAPSDMMDGRVGRIRTALDGEGLADVSILSYAAKYCSGFYGPFREAADSAPQFGDRRGYQMDPGNAAEAMREIQTDLEEGADMIMVKPALPYLDIVRRARERFDCPLVAYQVSGEYAMIKAAARAGWIDETRVVDETLTSIRRAGADLVITYYALDVAARL
jgi:porphobilinogen synthase